MIAVYDRHSYDLSAEPAAAYGKLHRFSGATVTADLVRVQHAARPHQRGWWMSHAVCEFQKIVLPHHI
jgi:hypothetical protein